MQVGLRLCRPPSVWIYCFVSVRVHNSVLATDRGAASCVTDANRRSRLVARAADLAQGGGGDLDLDCIAGSQFSFVLTVTRPGKTDDFLSASNLDARESCLVA